MDPFIEAEEADGHSVKRCCELFEVSRAAFYARRCATPTRRRLEDAELLEKIREIHATSKGTYGSPRVHAELRKDGVHVGKRRVTRLMRTNGLEGRCKRRFRKTTVADPAAEAARDLIGRSFAPSGDIDRRYVGDITYSAQFAVMCSGFARYVITGEPWRREPHIITALRGTRGADRVAGTE
jgi:putative transposase